MTTAIRYLFLTLLAFPAFADDSAHPLTLWEVKGTSNTVFLLGSIHLLRAEDYPLPSAIDSAYTEAEVLVMELDMDDIDPFKTQALINEYGVLQDERTLRDLMGEDMYQQAVVAAEAIDIPLDMLAKTEPWYAAMTVELLALGRIGFDPALGVEMYTMKKAAADGKRIDGLETMEEQLGFLDSMSLKAQNQMLLSTLTDGAELENMMDEVIDAWHRGDTDVLETSMLDEMAKHEELNKALLLDRNANWVGKIRELLNDRDDYLIVVGALHLIGPNGVPRQLEKIGYDIRQLSEPAKDPLR
jgi:uncharacterized protein YbaP (TraB family)